MRYDKLIELATKAKVINEHVSGLYAIIGSRGFPVGEAEKSIMEVINNKAKELISIESKIRKEVSW